MFNLEWTFNSRKISKRLPKVIEVKTKENQITERRNKLWQNKVNYEKRQNDIKAPIGVFNKAMSPIIFVTQMFGLMPVHNIFSLNVNDLKFRWKSQRMLYTFVVLSIMSFYTILEVKYKMAKTNLEHSIEFIITMLTCTSIMFKIISFSRNWPNLMRKWYDVEVIITKYQSKNYRRTLITKGMILAILLFGSNMFALISRMTRDYQDAIVCFNRSDSLTMFFRISTANIDNFQDDVIYLWFIFISAAKFWQNFIIYFMDFIMIMLCIGMIALFKTFNDNLMAAKRINMPISYWAIIRADYGRLVNLCKTLDDEICFLMMITLTHEVHSLSLNIYRGFNYFGHTDFYIRLWSFIIMDFSLCFVKMFAASEIYEQSKRPIKVLRCIPSWNIEARRFTIEVTTNVVALSYMKFFILTRSDILHVVGTIVTNELILIQYGDHEVLTRCDFVKKF